MEVAITDLRMGRLLVFVWLHTKNDPADEEWEAAFEVMNRSRRREGVPLADVRSLVISDGGAPGGLQRARLGHEFPIKWSVITTVLSNPVKRGIATALSWVNPRFFFAAPIDAIRALEHLDLVDQWEVLGAVFLDMQKKLPQNHTLELVEQALKSRP